MYPTLMIGVVLAVGAPAVKDPPKKDVSIVGEWIVEKLMVGDFDVSPKGKESLRFVFANDGQVTVTEDAKKPEVSEYKVDLKKSPAEIDILPTKDSKDKPMLGIFKIEGDVLTISCVEGTKDPRPTKFESTKESPTFLITLRRVKK